MFHVEHNELERSNPQEAHLNAFPIWRRFGAILALRALSRFGYFGDTEGSVFRCFTWNVMS